MMKKINFSKRALALIISLALLLSCSLTLTSCSLFGNRITEEQYATLADDLSANVEAGCEKEYNYVADYLDYWGFPAFSKFKLMMIESNYDAYFLDDLGYSEPDRLLALATTVARCYIDNILLTPDGEMALSYEQICSKSLQTDAVAAAYAASVGDKYSRYYSAEMFEVVMNELSGSFAGIGVNVMIDRDANTITVSSVVEGSSAESAGILPGDMLIGVDGESIDDYDVDIFMNLIRGDEGTEVTVTVLRDGEKIDFTMTRAHIEAPSVDYAMLEGGIAYVMITAFNGNTDEQFIEVIDEIEETGEARGYIFDLRDNGGGYLDTAVNLISYIVPRGTKIVAEVTKSGEVWHNSNSDHVIDLPMVVLCNGNTASAGELFTAAIRDYRNDGLLDAKIIGEKTYTKGKMQSIIPLTDGSAIVFTTGLFNPPSGVNFDGEGITPDIIVSYDYESETDEQLDVAIEEITNMINSK